jgi:hypothetical protein
MDEILIGEKKYVSSKRAAKVTGYAKDYIGQLCREGRVPARLVGRSWYVLESAIHDHRFGDHKTAGESESSPIITSSWASPRYEGSSSETLPALNRLQDEAPAAQEEDSTAQRLQDSWKAWFDRVAESEPAIPDIVPHKPEIEESRDEEEVVVPVRAIHHELPEDLLPRRTRNFSDVQPQYEELAEEEEVMQRGVRGYTTTLQMAGAVFALLFASLAVAGTGYFDRYIISNSQVGIIAGVSLYNR